MASYSSILAWRIPWTEEPDSLQSMGLQSQTQLTNIHRLKMKHNKLNLQISQIIMLKLAYNLPSRT